MRASRSPISLVVAIAGTRALRMFVGTFGTRATVCNAVGTCGASGTPSDVDQTWTAT